LAVLMSPALHAASASLMSEVARLTSLVPVGLAAAVRDAWAS
jgi:hypothetical protein